MKTMSSLVPLIVLIAWGQKAPLILSPTASPGSPHNAKTGKKYELTFLSFCWNIVSVAKRLQKSISVSVSVKTFSFGGLVCMFYLHFLFERLVHFVEECNG